MPHLQADIRDRYGSFIGHTDYFYPWCSVGVEYDGDGKYFGRFGLSPTQVAQAEMQRTKTMNNAGLQLVRITRSTHQDGSWQSDLWEALERGKIHGAPFPENQWSSAGLAWGRAKYGTKKRHRQTPAPELVCPGNRANAPPTSAIQEVPVP